MRPIKTRFGTRAPRVPAVLEALTAATGTLVAHVHDLPLGLGVVGEGLELFARFGREIRGELTAQDGRKLVPKTHVLRAME